jgi:hypothetical protein
MNSGADHWIEMYGTKCIGYHGYINGHYKSEADERKGDELMKRRTPRPKSVINSINRYNYNNHK